MRVALAGGGTGGHIYPAIAIAEALERTPAAHPLQALFIGSRGRLEERIVPGAGYSIAFVASAPLERRPSFAILGTVVRNALGVAQEFIVLHRFQPDLLVATGGYVAFPVVVALRLVRLAGLSRARIALLEPNAVPGLANRLLEPLADEIWLSFTPSEKLGSREVVTGTPVRASFGEPIEASEARARLGLDPSKTTVVVLGGSLGARRLNEAVTALAGSGMLPHDWQLLHLTGSDPAMRTTAPGLRQIEYLDDPRPAYAAADVIVARAGASTLAEIAATMKPAILVPFPFATDDHQTLNAERFAAGGAACVVSDAEFDAQRLLIELRAVLEPRRLEELGAAARRGPLRDAANAIAARAVALVSPSCSRVQPRSSANGERP